MDQSTPTNENTTQTSTDGFRLTLPESTGAAVSAPKGEGSVEVDSAISAHAKPVPHDLKGEEDHTLAKGWSVHFRGYVVGLGGTVCILPIIVSSMTVILYFSAPLPFPFLPFPTPGWYSPAFGALLAFIVWLVSPFFYYPFTTVEGANRRSYGQLIARLDQLASPTSCDVEARIQPGTRGLRL